MPFIGDEEIFHDRQQVMLQSKELPIQLYLLLTTRWRYKTEYREDRLFVVLNTTLMLLLIKTL